jgi:hypothetical protein
MEIGACSARADGTKVPIPGGTDGLSTGPVDRLATGELSPFVRRSRLGCPELRLRGSGQGLRPDHRRGTVN